MLQKYRETEWEEERIEYRLGKNEWFIFKETHKSHKTVHN